MSSTKRFAAPRTIRRIAARRVFQSASGRPVVLTIGVPQPLPGWDWGCALQITGLKTAWRRPRYVFGVDAIQALHLAMKHAGVILESTKPKLAWFGESNLGMPRFLPDLPKREQDRLKSMVEREALRFWRGVVRAGAPAGFQRRQRASVVDRRTRPEMISAGDRRRKA